MSDVEYKYDLLLSIRYWFRCLEVLLSGYYSATARIARFTLVESGFRL